MVNVRWCATIFLALACGASGGTVSLELRWYGEPGLHELKLTPSQTASIELWATVSPGDTVATANIAWNILESSPGGFTILSREIATGWYDFISDPFPQPSTYLHGFFTGEGAGNSTGTFLLERYVIHELNTYAAAISVVASNPLNPSQLTEINDETSAHSVILPSPLVLHGIPEPAALALLALGGLPALRRHRV